MFLRDFPTVDPFWKIQQKFHTFTHYYWRLFKIKFNTDKF